MISKEQGADKAEGASDVVIYKVEVPANRSVSKEKDYCNPTPLPTSLAQHHNTPPHLQTPTQMQTDLVDHKVAFVCKKMWKYRSTAIHVICSVFLICQFDIDPQI